MTRTEHRVHDGICIVAMLKSLGVPVFMGPQNSFFLLGGILCGVRCPAHKHHALSRSIGTTQRISCSITPVDLIHYMDVTWFSAHILVVGLCQNDPLARCELRDRTVPR